MKISRIVCALCMTVVLGSSCCFAANAPIDIQHHWAKDEIYTIIENNVMQGFPNERFKPCQTLTRAQFAQILYNLDMTEQEENEKNIYDGLSSEDIEIEKICNDEVAEWAFPAVEWALNNQIIELYSDGEFKQSVYVDRAMAATILHNYLKYKEYNFEKDEDITLTDIEECEAKESIEILCREGIILGYEDNTFRPNKLVKRAEVATLVRKMQGMELLECPVELPTYNVIDVPYYSQVYPVSALVGCEATSLFMALKGKGYAEGIELYEFLDNLPRHSSNPAKGFVGSPFVPDKTKKTRTTIYPPKLTEYARQYGNVEDFSGADVEELRAEILAGNPVVAYATMRWEKPFYREYDIEGETQSLLSNNHVILVCGYKTETNEYYIADPYNINNINEELRYWIDGYTFEKIYNERRHALVIK